MNNTKNKIEGKYIFPKSHDEYAIQQYGIEWFLEKLENLLLELNRAESSKMPNISSYEKREINKARKYYNCAIKRITLEI